MQDASLGHYKGWFLDLAAFCHEPAPTHVRGATTNLARAELALHGSKPADDAAALGTPVMVITGQGAFLVPRRPWAGAIGTGRHLTGIWLYPAGRMTSYSIQDREPDLGSLGPLTDLC